MKHYKLVENICFFVSGNFSNILYDPILTWIYKDSYFLITKETIIKGNNTEKSPRIKENIYKFFWGFPYHDGYKFNHSLYVPEEILMEFSEYLRKENG